MPEGSIRNWEFISAHWRILLRHWPPVEMETTCWGNDGRIKVKALGKFWLLFPHHPGHVSSSEKNVTELGNYNEPSN